MASINIRGAFGNLDEIKILLKRCDLDILLIQETFLNASISDAQLEIGGYNLYRLDRSGRCGKKSGGGLLAYATCKRDIEHIVDWDTSERHLESMWLKLSLKETRDTYVCNMYRAPDGDPKLYMESMESRFNEITMLRNPDIICMGDTNSDLSQRINTNVNKQLKRMLAINNMEQLVREPTRVRHKYLKYPDRPYIL